MQFSFLWTHLGLCAHVLGVHKIGTETERKMSLKPENHELTKDSERDKLMMEKLTVGR